MSAFASVNMEHEPYRKAFLRLVAASVWERGNKRAHGDVVLAMSTADLNEFCAALGIVPANFDEDAFAAIDRLSQEDDHA
jgi:hypothetical protein